MHQPITTEQAHTLQIRLAERALDIQAATGCTYTDAYKQACAEVQR
jgi:hypothetical protein